MEGRPGEIASLPATLTSQGVWCLKKDLSTDIASGAAITIDANNVTIDCNGFKLGGLQAGAGTGATGILIDERGNAVIRGCNVRGFSVGVDAQGGFGHVIEDNRFVASTRIGLSIGAPQSVVRRNHVTDTGGSLVGSHAFAVTVASGVDVIDNTIAGVAATTGGTSFGIIGVSNTGGTISGNRLSALLKPAEGDVVGIAVSLGVVVVEGNTLIGTYQTGSTAISCSHNTGTSVRNTIVGFTTGIENCHSTGDVINPN